MKVRKGREGEGREEKGRVEKNKESIHCLFRRKEKGEKKKTHFPSKSSKGVSKKKDGCWLVGSTEQKLISWNVVGLTDQSP